MFFIPSPHESGLSCLAIVYYVEYLAHPSPPIYNVWLGKCSFVTFRLSLCEQNYFFAVNNYENCLATLSYKHSRKILVVLLLRLKLASNSKLQKSIFWHVLWAKTWPVLYKMFFCC